MKQKYILLKDHTIELYNKFDLVVVMTNTANESIEIDIVENLYYINIDLCVQGLRFSFFCDKVQFFDSNDTEIATLTPERG